VVSSTGKRLNSFVLPHRKLYGCATASVINYCKSILATLIRDAVGDSSNSIRSKPYSAIIL